MSKSVKINDHSVSVVEYVADQKGLDVNAATDYLLGIAWSRYQAVTKYAAKDGPKEGRKKKAAKKEGAKKKAAKKGGKKKGAAKDKKVSTKPKKADPEISIEDAGEAD